MSARFHLCRPARTAHPDTPSSDRNGPCGQGVRWGLALLLGSLAPLSLAAPPQMPPPMVGVKKIEAQTVEVYAEYPARARAMREVEVRAQAGGILVGRGYQEGVAVEAGQSLFRIDPRPYQARIKQAEAELLNAQANLNKAKRDWNRVASLFEKKVASEQDRDNTRSALELAEAGVELARAKLDAARIEFDYTNVRAPIAGVSGLRAVSRGNLIEEGDLLTTITQIDPIQVVFSFSTNDPYAHSPALSAGAGQPLPARLVGANGQELPLEGQVNFHGATVDQKTDTVLARAVFSNSEGRVRPNEFLRIRMQVEKRENALIVPETAIGSGPKPGSTIVYVLGAEDKVKATPVVLGPRVTQGRVIEQGLSAGQTVVVEGLIKLRDGLQVKPAAPDASAQPPSPGKEAR